MNLLITGATGFIGRHFIPLIRGQCMNIAVIVRDSEKTQKSLPFYDEITIIDLHDNTWANSVKKFNPDVVLHLASYLTNKRDFETLNKLIDVNITLGTHILNALEDTRCKYFINTGTFAEYLYNDKQLVSSSYYAATKSAFRKILELYQSIYGFKWINVIPFTIYGGVDTQKKVIDYIIESLDSHTPIKMTPGEQVLDFIHIDDVCLFYATLLSNLEKINEPYIEFELGTGIGTAIKQLAGMISDLSGRKTNIDWGGLPYRERETMYSVADTTNLKTIFGWLPIIYLSDGIKSML